MVSYQLNYALKFCKFYGCRYSLVAIAHMISLGVEFKSIIIIFKIQNVYIFFKIMYNMID